MHLLTRHWHSLSPALQRYYRVSLLPSAVLLGLAALHEWSTRQPGLATSMRMACALAPMLAMAWIFALYLRFLRECDELERRIELLALAWAAGITVHALMAAVFLLDAGLAHWPGKQVAGWSAVLLLGSYGVIRGILHRRYA